MKVTLDLDEDVLMAAKEIAQIERISAGKCLSNLARRGLTIRYKSRRKMRGGVPVIPSRGEIITSNQVHRLMENDRE
jgi:hypothetical protein